MIFKILKKVFFWIGLVFVLFASLLFSNFIATSISYKKEEIGILRAIGSRGNDVFRIFFAESFIIAMINFILSFLGTVLVCLAINLLIKSSTGILLTVLTVSIRQAILLFGVCLLSAFIACYLPVRKIAAKRPIDAIRDR
jgi:ABC-type lipoprotein release transport system permease subunit